MRKRIKIERLHTYCKVESNARKLPSFPLDHLLISASRASASLCIQDSIHDNQVNICINKQVCNNSNLVEVYTFFSASSFWARRSRIFFSARAFAWKIPQVIRTGRKNKNERNLNHIFTHKHDKYQPNKLSSS